MFDIDFEERAPSSHVLIDNLINVVTFDIIPADDFTVPILGPPEYDQEYIAKHSFAYGAGYEFLHTINSLNFTFLFLVSIIALSVMIKLVSLKKH